ncbi:hypothetical protein KFZ70_11080 [Tamlana fucoidanivorans]|uniref:Glycosyltransferase family 4 protein n=1 Tax=Allotamlana fucoidanivorans TaxID=2583814 RepID=A0A5C4SHI2_9FLAO|nr:hypothetical protein [Tamlana fucoidanivorans]TNJ43178.1 hypothetical protein FGF67_12555 [Tamlana fucoidanivorans]
MRICLISFDYWDYDHHIVNTLQKKGIDATHIDISKYKYVYKSVFEKLGNFLSKTFLKKNKKKINRQKYILNTLEKIGKQDYILVIRPDLIDKPTHLAIKGFTKNYIAYIYDSCKRFPINHLLNDVFNRIFSFDLEDVKTYNFEHITNYIYLDKQDIRHDFEYDLFMVMSPDQRIKQLNKLAKKLDDNNVSYKFIVVSKKRPSNLYKGIEHSNNDIDTTQLNLYLNRSKVMLDLVRKGHNGLSFRIFEALAYQKKIITTNHTVKEYAFYKANNILVLNDDDFSINPQFFKTEYIPLEKNIYYKFTVDHFVEQVFDLQKN